MAKLNYKNLLIFLDIFVGIIIFLVIFHAKPSALSSHIAILISISSIFPGIFLASYSRSIVTGKILNVEKLFRKILFSILINFCILSIYFFYFRTMQAHPFENIFMCTFVSASSSFQALSIVWFYLYDNKKKFFIIKLLSSFLRLSGVAISYITLDLVFFLVINALVPIFEGIVSKFNTVSSNKENIYYVPPRSDTLLFSISVGSSRAVFSVIKIFIEKSMMGALPILLIFEQIIAGMMSIFEKYIVRDFKLSKKLVNIKLIFAIFMLLFLIFYIRFQPSNLANKCLLGFSALITALPAAMNYKIIKNNGLKVIAFITILSSMISIIIALLNYYALHLPMLYLFAYNLLPISIFLLSLKYNGYKKW
jgi:hypothetical protein